MGLAIDGGKRDEGATDNTHDGNYDQVGRRLPPTTESHDEDDGHCECNKGLARGCADVLARSLGDDKTLEPNTPMI